MFITNFNARTIMPTVKKYNLAGLNANVELGKQGSYIAGNASAIGFYTSAGALQKIAIANATVGTEAVTKAQLDEASGELVQHITVDVDYDSGSANLASIAAGSRILSVTVDIPGAWGGTLNNTTTFIEVGDTSNGSRFIRAQDADVLKVGQYHSQYQYEYTSAGTLKYTVTQGTATSGSATISVVLASDAVVVTDYGSINQSQNSNNDLGNITL
jgi:hypothetical protein